MASVPGLQFVLEQARSRGAAMIFITGSVYLGVTFFVMSDITANYDFRIVEQTTAIFRAAMFLSGGALTLVFVQMTANMYMKKSASVGFAGLATLAFFFAIVGTIQYFVANSLGG